MDNLDHIIKQLQAFHRELKEANDRADAIEAEMASLERALKVNAWQFKYYPRVVRNFDSDTMAVYCGDGRTA